MLRLHHVRHKWVWGTGRMIMTGKWSTQRKACPSAASSSSNLTWTALELNLGLASEGLANTAWVMAHPLSTTLGLQTWSVINSWTATVQKATTRNREESEQESEGLDSDTLCTTAHLWCFICVDFCNVRATGMVINTSLVSHQCIWKMFWPLAAYHYALTLTKQAIMTWKHELNYNNSAVNLWVWYCFDWKLWKRKKYSVFFHIISFMNTQSADYYVFSTITMMTLNTAVWYTKTTGWNYYVYKNIASIMSKFCPHHIKLYKATAKIINYNVQEGIQKKDYECGTINRVELIIGCGTRMWQFPDCWWDELCSKQGK